MNGMISSGCDAKRSETLDDVFGELVRLRSRLGEAAMEASRARNVLCGPWPCDPCEIAEKSPEPTGGAVEAHACVVAEMHRVVSDVMSHLSYINEAIGGRS